MPPVSLVQEQRKAMPKQEATPMPVGTTLRTTMPMLVGTTLQLETLPRALD